MQRNIQPILNAALDKKRQRLFNRVAESGRFIATPLLVEEFAQMTVSECSSYVRGVELCLRRLAEASQ